MEKRKYIRMNSDFVIWYQTIDEEKEFSFGKEPSVNVSAGGIQLDMEDVDAIGTTLILKFKIPNYDNEIEAKGRVVWVKRGSERNLVGIEFLKISQDDMQAISALAEK
ncbi:MAG: PilZ domain-containing protein [Spirochaetes bacterium]|nr:PilZ domain-containing protein [Spirochaetota bacterium]